MIEDGASMGAGCARTGQEGTEVLVHADELAKE